MRFYLVTGAMSRGAEIQLYSHTLSAPSKEAALGEAMNTAQRQFPGYAANAFNTYDVTDAVLDYARYILDVEVTQS